MIARFTSAALLCLSLSFAASARGPSTNACEARPCGQNARCVQTGPGKHACVCNKGWMSKGDNKNCKLENACAERNACGQNAHCIQTGPGNKSCQCNKGFKGDGKTCKRG
jgi:hypothetical protein